MQTATVVTAGVSSDGAVVAAQTAVTTREGVSRKPIVHPGSMERDFPAFVENKGQWDARARFRLGSGNSMWLTDAGIIFDVRRPSDDAKTLSPAAPTRDNTVRRKIATRGGQRLVFTERLVGANKHPMLEPSVEQPGTYNYLSGSDPSKWHTGVRAYRNITYRDIWKKIDFRLVSNGRDLEQEFIVRPGGDPAQIQVAYRGVKGLLIAQDGALLVRTAFGELREMTPRIYQDIGGERVAVRGHFKLSNKKSYGFVVEKFDERYALVIDPTLLYSTFLGGSGSDQAVGIAVDPIGSAYLTGYTDSPDFPTTPGAYQATAGRMFMAKLSPLGDSLVYSTYLGAGARAYAIAVDAVGETYVAGGNASADLPTTGNAFQTQCGDSFFLTKLNAQGNGLLYSTCLGSNMAGIYGTGIYSIALAPDGRAYIAGWGGAGLPTTAGAFQTQNALLQNGANAYVAIVDPTKSGSVSLQYGTYLGGGTRQCIQADRANGIAVDAQGMIYVTGVASSLDFPTTPNAFLTTFPAAGQPCDLGPGYYRYTAFVAKLNPLIVGQASLVYSTFLGGPGYAWANGIAVDSSGNAYVTGYTAWSYLFPTTPGSLRTTASPTNNNDVFDGFVTKLNSSGNALVYSTLLGSPTSDDPQGRGIAVDQSGNAYVAGSTLGASFPTTSDAIQPIAPGSGGNGFLSRLSSDGTKLTYSTYLGGVQGDSVATSIALSPTGDAFVAGFTASPGFPVTQNAFQPAAHGNWDAFVTKFSTGTTAGLSIAGVVPSGGGNSGSVTATVTGTGFLSGATVKLSCPGQLDIVAFNVLVGPDGRSITGTFSLRTAQADTCNIIIVNPDGTSASDLSAFTIFAGGAPSMWVDIVGVHKARGGTPQNYYVVYGNNGTIDATDVTVTIQVPSVLLWQPQQGQTPIYQSQTNGNTLRTFVLPRVAPQSAGTIVIALTAPPLGVDASMPFQFRAWTNPR